MGVSGSLRDMTLTTLISVNCTEGNQARLRLQREGQEAYIYFAEGNIVHVVLGDHEGEEVIYDLLTWEDGQFELELDVLSPAHTVDTPWSNLVLEGMRLLDEVALEKERLEQLEQSRKEAMMAELSDLLQEMAADIPGFVSTGVVGMDGLSIAEHSASPDYDGEVSSAQFALVMKLVQRTAEQLKIGDLEDNLVTTKDNYIITRLLGDGSFYLSVAVDKDRASLGNVRLVTRRFASRLWDSIPKG